MKGKKAVLRPAQRVALCYGLAAALWALYCLVGSGIMLNYKLSGRMPQQTLAFDDLRAESLVPYPAQEGWLVSSDADPHLTWEGEGYLETVALQADYGLPPGGVALYWLVPGQDGYTEKQKVFARCTPQGDYVFELGGRYVSALRIDPDSLGGVPVRVRAVVLNPDRPWYRRFVPGGGAWLLLLFAPVLAAAVWQALAPGKSER